MPVKKFTFAQAVTTGLQSLDAREAGTYGWQIRFVTEHG